MPDSFSPVFILGILLTVGSLAGRFSEKINFPRVVSYILIGAIFSPGILGNTFNFSTENWSPFLTDVALGIIAYIIGSEININDLKKGRKNYHLLCIGTIYWYSACCSLRVMGFRIFFLRIGRNKF